MRIKRLRLKIDAGTLSGNLSKDDKGRSLCILNKSHVGHNVVISETQAHYPKCVSTKICKHGPLNRFVSGADKKVASQN